MKTLLAWFAVVGLLSGAAFQSLLTADESVPETVLGVLDHPCGVAIQPETGTVFVAESGRGRIVRVVDGKAEEVIVGLPRASLRNVSDSRHRFPIGPMGLAFFDKKTLVIGCAGQADSADRLYRIDLPEAGSPPVVADASTSVGPPTPQASQAIAEEFLGITVLRDVVLVTANGADGHGWVLGSTIARGTPAPAPGLGPSNVRIPTSGSPPLSTLGGLSISPRGEIVVGELGRLDQPHDSRLLFFRPSDGRPLLSLAAQLHDITALAYGAPLAPTHHMALYALDFAWLDTMQGGLYRLDAVLENEVQAIRPTRIASLQRPTSLAIGLDGSMYVTTLGGTGTSENEKGNENETPSGRLVRFAPGL
jgi:hypothetical protein